MPYQKFLSPTDIVPVDWTGNNHVIALSEELIKLRTRIKRDTARVKEIADELKDDMGEASRAVAPGWRWRIKTFLRNEYVVKAQTIRSLHVEQTVEDEEETEY